MKDAHSMQEEGLVFLQASTMLVWTGAALHHSTLACADV